MEADRMKSLSSAVFSEVAKMQQAARAKGIDVIQLSIGSPDLLPAQHVTEALCRAAARPDSYGYTLTKGRPDFLRAVADWYKERYEVELDPETEVHSLIGSQEGLSHIGLCLVNPGDVVLVPDPGYPIYCAGPLMAGARLEFMPLKAENAYLPDLKAIPPAVLNKTKMMILNYPNNPLAAVASREFFSEVIELAAKYDFIVCHDFAYSELVFDGYRPESFLKLPGAREVGVEFNSLSKTYNLCGCRIGYVVGNAKVLELLSRLKSNFDYGVFAPLQAAAVAALSGPQDHVRATAETYRRRRDIVVEGLNRFGWKLEKPKASMYVWAPTPEKKNSLAFAAELLQNTGIAVIPGSAFGECGEGFVRFALVQPEERLAEGVERIGRWLGK